MLLFNLSFLIIDILGGIIAIIISIFLLLLWIVSLGHVVVGDLISTVWNIFTFPAKLYSLEMELFDKIPVEIIFYLPLILILILVVISVIQSVFVFINRKQLRGV